MEVLDVRLAFAEESNAIAEVFAAAFASLRTIYRPTIEAVERQEQRAPTEACVVAELAGQIVGTVLVDRHRDHLHLSRLVVHPDFQRRGIATLMIDWIGSHLTTRQDCQIVLTTIRESGNVAVFERMGFEVVDEQVARWCQSDRFEHLHDVTMAKQIRAPAERGDGTA